MTLTPDQARTALAGLRITVGTGAILAPRLFGRMFGLRPEQNPEAPLLGRMFGARDLAMAAPLLGDDEGERDRWLGYGIAIDLADAGALLAGGARGYLAKQTVILGTATALGAAALGIIARGD